VTEDELRDLTKAEVHVHLEGTLSAQDIAALAADAGEPLPRPLDQIFVLDGLGAFLDFLDWQCALVRTGEQLARIAYRFAERQAACGVRYADAIVNPTHWPAWRYRLDAFVDALDQGLREAEQDGLTPTGLCLSLLRQQRAAEAAELVDWLVERRHPRVVALSIDGNEAAAGRTGARFADAFRRAGAAGLCRTVHAGESSGPEGVWDAVELLGADRIDHGIRAVEDPEVVRLLVDRAIPLGVCVSSNLRLGVVGDAADHPVERLRQAGVRVSLNTDDPAPLGTSVEREYALCVATFGWDDKTVRDIARTSIEASFCDPDRKRDLLEAL
jgi:adenosine deaminase